MHSTELSHEQAEALKRGIYPCLNYLSRLKKRVEKTLTIDDPLHQLVTKAFDAVHNLSVHVHYLACDGGGFRHSLEENVRAPEEMQRVSKVLRDVARVVCPRRAGAGRSGTG